MLQFMRQSIGYGQSWFWWNDPAHEVYQMVMFTVRNNDPGLS